MDCTKNLIGFTRAIVYSLAPIALPKPFYDATGGPFNNVFLENWLELYDDDGVCGQTICTSLMAKTFLPLILTGEKKTYEEWYNSLYWKMRNTGFSSQSVIELGRLDLAIHDIFAKKAGLPLHRYLGATRDWVNVYASGGGTGLTNKELEEEVTSYVKDGYKVIKMKIATSFGSQIEKDIKRIALVRKAIGKDIKLAVDANQCWNAVEALDFIKRVEEYDIAWYEEPVHSADLEELSKLIKVCPVPVAMGESMRNRYAMKSYIDCGVQHLQPVPANMGGIADWMSTRDMAISKGLALTSGGHSHITAAYIATAPEDAMVEYLVPIIRSLGEIMERLPEEKNGKFYLSSQPGLPVSLDWNLLERKKIILKKEYFYA